MDNLDRLANLLHGRNAEAKDWLGGSTATILLEAVFEIERLRRDEEVMEAQNTSANISIMSCKYGINSCKFDKTKVCRWCYPDKYKLART